jgi:hypothetical protein
MAKNGDWGRVIHKVFPEKIEKKAKVGSGK